MKTNKKILIIGGVVIVIIALISVYFFRSKTSKYDFVVAQRGEVVQEVGVTGKVRPVHEVGLTFESAGRVTAINASVGDRVSLGQPIVYLYNADLLAQLEQAQADVLSEQAKLEELKLGTRPEEIMVQEAKLADAKVSVNEAKQNLVDKINDAYTKSDDSIRNKVDQFFIIRELPIRS